MHSYETKLFKIDIPHEWVLERQMAPYMPLAVKINYNSNDIVPNYNITLLEPNHKKLEDIAIQNSANNCAKGSCKVSKMVPIKINQKDGYKSYQELVINNKLLVVEQYYIEDENTVYLISFFCLKKDREINKEIFDRIASSFKVR